MIFQETRDYLKKVGLPEGDLWDLPTSTKRFPDGCHYRIEVPTINTADAVASLLDTATKNNITINRVTETYGMFRHTAAEIKQYCKLCADYGAELLLSVGPRATYDTGATVLSDQGVRISYRLRGMEQVVRAIEDIKRGYDYGCRGFLIYDEGMLWLINQMRKEGGLPSDITFKASAHLGHCNPCSVKLLESLGADSINPVRDLQLPMLAALRAAHWISTWTIPQDLVVSSVYTKRPRSCGWLHLCTARQATRLFQGMDSSLRPLMARRWPTRHRSLLK